MWLLNYSRSPCAAGDWLRGKTSPIPVPKHPHSGLFGRQRCSKSAGRCRLHIQLIQWSRPTCVTVIFVFISLSCCLKRVEGRASLLLLAKQRQQNRCVRSLRWKRRFGQSFAQNAEVNRLLETPICFPHVYLLSDVPAVLPMLCEGIWSRPERRPGQSSLIHNEDKPVKFTCVSSEKSGIGFHKSLHFWDSNRIDLIF